MHDEIPRRYLDIKCVNTLGPLARTESCYRGDGHWPQETVTHKISTFSATIGNLLLIKLVRITFTRRAFKDKTHFHPFQGPRVTKRDDSQEKCYCKIHYLLNKKIQECPHVKCIWDFFCSYITILTFRHFVPW